MVYKTLTSFPKGKKCQLCLTAKVDPEALGNICRTADVIVHYFCLLLASKIQQKGTDKQGLLGFFSRDIKKEIKRGSTIVCSYCKKTGATVMCSKENCHLKFHVPCAQQKGSLHQYFNQFKSFCGKHKPRQKIPASLKKRGDLECVLCCSHIKFNVKSHEEDPIWPTCCNPQALLHKRCLQHFATSAGYYFKCPFCSNKPEFYQGMKTFGIYIPEQEASWETEPNAYRELLERDINCDAAICRCPRGRDYSLRNSKWFLDICILCGASGQHTGCMLEDIMPETYECEVCSIVNIRFPDPVPHEDMPESSPLNDNGEGNETVQQSVEGNISMECEDIIVISDSESENNEVEVVDVVPPPTVTKNVRKRQLPARRERHSGLKRQRLAEGVAETSSEMCFTIDEESGSSLSQATDNPSLRTDELSNIPRTSEINSPNREEPVNERINSDPVLESSNVILTIAKVCTLSDCNQTEIDQLNAGSSSPVVHNSQNHTGYIDLTENETNEVLVISDTDNESIASSLLDSDTSLLDLSEIPESEKSSLFENFPPPKNYAKEFSRRNQKKRRKRKKRATPKKRKTSASSTPNPKCNLRIHLISRKEDETLSNAKINILSDQRKLEPTSSSEVGNTNIPSSTLITNSSSSGDESFRGFSSQEARSNNDTIGISTPILADRSMHTNETYEENSIHSEQPISGNHIFLSSVDDNNKCSNLDNLSLIDEVKNINSQVTDLVENAQPTCADDNSVESVVNNIELSKCKNSNYTNVTVTSLQEPHSNESSTDGVICNSDPLEPSRSIKNISENKIESEKSEVPQEVPHKATDDESNVNNLLIEEHTSEKKTLKTKMKPANDVSDKSMSTPKTRQSYKNNNRPKILCSLPLKETFGIINQSLSNLKETQHHKNNSCNTSSDTGLLRVGDGFNANEADSGLLDISTNQLFNVSYNTIEDSQSPKRIEFELESHSSKSCSSETHRKLGSPMFGVDALRSQLSEKVVEPKMIYNSKDVPLNSNQTQVDETSSKIASEAPLKSKSTENISGISPVVSSLCTSHDSINLQASECDESSIKLDSMDTTHKAELKSQLFTEDSEFHENCLLENETSTSQARFQENSESNLEIQMESRSIEDMVELDSSKCVSKFSKKSDLSKFNSEFSNFLEDKVNLKSHGYSSDQDLQSPKLDSAEITQMESKSSKETEIKPVLPKCISNFTKKSDKSPVLYEPHFVQESSKLNSEFSNGLQDKANSKIPTINHLLVDSSNHQGSCELKSKKSLKVLKNSSKATPNLKIETSKSSKIKGSKGKPKDSYKTKKKASFQNKASETNNSENPAEITHASKQLKEEETQLNLVVVPSEVNISQDELVSETHEFCDDPVFHQKCNVNPEDSTMSPSLDAELSECFKTLVQANKRKVQEFKTAVTTHETTLSLEIENNLKGIEHSMAVNCEMGSIRKKGDVIVTDRNNEFPFRDIEKQLSIKDSKIHSNIETTYSCDKSFHSPIVEEIGECSSNLSADNKKEKCKTVLVTTEENNFKDFDNVCLIKNQSDDFKNVVDGSKFNCASNDSDKTEHGWYKICITDCSTCSNSTTLTAKHNIKKNDSIDVCFYCKDKINNTSHDTPISQIPSICSCQENENNLSFNCSSGDEQHKNLFSTVYNDDKFSKDNSLIGSDLNSNYRSEKPLEKQRSFEDYLKNDCNEMITLEAKPSSLSPERRKIVPELKQSPIQHMSNLNSLIVSGFAKNYVQLTSDKKETKIKLDNIDKDESTAIHKKSPIQRICDKVDDDKKRHELKHYHNEIFKVRIHLKEVKQDNSHSLMTHVETLWLRNRRQLRELLKAKYFSENDKKLVLYTDVCGFRYSRLFIENIPEKIDSKVVFETGGDIPYYLQKLINSHGAKQIGPQIVLIVYGNTLIPDENVFRLLQSASNLNNIKLIVTTVCSQTPKVLQFNKKLMYYSKKYGYHVWDITKIHFLQER